MRLHLHDKSQAEGRAEGTVGSKRRIRAFVDAYDIDMGDFEPSDMDQYQTFEAFFARRHRAGSRPIAEQSSGGRAVVVADSRLVVYGSLAEAKAVWIKGHDFSIASLVMDVALGDRFACAAVASFRLSPQDCHRYHSPVRGRVRLFRSLPGDYSQVDLAALQSEVDVLTRNRRELVLIDTEDFGDVLFVAIGATNVGSVQIHEPWRRPGGWIDKGEELGLFQFGASSSIMLAFEPGRITFDDDLLDLSKQKIQTFVEAGMSLGDATAPGEEQVSLEQDICERE
ncbi:hypothetical protein CDD83_7535 [Cordyceps sp. RAO-2017]|nr:hypothetical protein CDD83_7535 [Cordyceps sp. RAO-2017]